MRRTLATAALTLVVASGAAPALAAPAYPPTTPPVVAPSVAPVDGPVAGDTGLVARQDAPDSTGLALTGTQVAGTAAAGLALVLGGAVLLAVRRRTVATA